MSTQLPGRLGNPELSFSDDPRADPRIAEALKLMELAPGVEPIDPGSSYEDVLAYATAFEDAGTVTHPMQLEAMPDFSHIDSRTEVIKGVDGNDINLYIHRAKDNNAAAPCIVHTHGGGMVVMTAQDPGFIRWRNDLAAAGMVVVGVEFRNGAGKLGNHPYPAGLNDCASAVQWVAENKAALNISNIVISGESGGGNLSIATTLKAHKEGWSQLISGVYACCPYISGEYANPPAELVSLAENDTYMLDSNQMALLVKAYDPTGEAAGDPLAWPLHATTEELAGLPPHIISVNELDPLRDEGLAFFHKLLAAGVPVTARTVHGTPHAGDLMFPDIAPEHYWETLRGLTGFASSL